MHQQDLTHVLFGQLGFPILLSWIDAANPAAQAEILSRRVRGSVLLICCNLCESVFGGTTPLLATHLVARTVDDFAPVSTSSH